MKVIREAHRYELDSFEGTNTQTLQFIEKEKQGEEYVTVNDGTTNEEVIEVLIDRIGKLNEKFSSPFNKSALNHLKAALSHLNARTADRKGRGVEGKPKD